jgi:ribosome-associated toxin RatA of RatAB toxin-antitoxin module
MIEPLVLIVLMRLRGVSMGQAYPDGLDNSRLETQDADLGAIAVDDDGAALQGIEVATEVVDKRTRRISAEIWLPHALDDIWQLLTDYDRLAEFIPNLDQSRVIPSPDASTTRIEQIGAECFMTIRFCARVVLDMAESFPHRIDFQMVEGDFRNFAGSWQLQPHTREGQPGTQLCYTVQVEPTRLMPIGLIERHLRKNLAVNLAAIRHQAQQVFAPSA